MIASENAQRALNAVFDPGFAGIPEEEKICWGMAAVIHCDMCRLVAALDECKTPGLAKLMWMAEIASKLYEAKGWYFKTGSKLLLKIASEKSCGSDPVQARLKRLRSDYPISRIDRLAIYRNKVGYHYDSNTLEVIRHLGHESAEDFFEILMTFVRFSGEWVALAKEVIQGTLPAFGDLPETT